MYVNVTKMGIQVIKVISSIMGTGKTTRMFEMMKEMSDKRYIYISIFLDEVGNGNTGEAGRIQKALPEMNFRMPRNEGDGKVSSMKQLVHWGSNIATTHSLLRMFDKDVVDMIIEKEYTIVIDEAVDCIGLYDELSVGDVQTLLESQQILVGEDSRVSWNHDKYGFDDVRYEDVVELADSGFLYLFGDHALVTEYPPRLLKDAKDVVILSYLFEGSMMASWLKVNKVDYHYIDPSAIGLLPEIEVKKSIRDNLELVYSKELHSKGYRDTAFSSTWFKNANSTQRRRVKKALEACVNTHKCKRGEVFWTTFKPRRASLEGKGYTQKTSGGLDPFLPFNIKAINSYSEFTMAMYAVNVYKHPTEIAYLKSRGVDFNQDTYALSECLQFLWRGAIRQGKPMKVLIASKRMKKLVEDWLGEG